MVVAVEEIILDMTQEARELLQKALALPENERAELAGNLIYFPLKFLSLR
jgi:hypothetical protein